MTRTSCLWTGKCIFKYLFEEKEILSIFWRRFVLAEIERESARNDNSALEIGNMILISNFPCSVELSFFAVSFNLFYLSGEITAFETLCPYILLFVLCYC